MINFQRVAQFQALLAQKNLQILVVAKNTDHQQIRSLYEHTGWRHIAESRIDALREKRDALRDLPLKWHYIGPLQSRKIRIIVDHCDHIQTVCRSKELGIIEQAAQQLGKTISIWIQIDYSALPGRSGCKESEVIGLAETAGRMENIQLEGLMTMALPNDHSAFNKLNQFREKSLPILKCSMGMSNDYHHAIEQKSDLIRIGRALFNE